MSIGILACALQLSACGFSPVYGTHSNNSSPRSTTTETELNNIEISIIPNREGQFLRNALMDRFYNKGIPSDTRYLLTISPLVETTYNFDITVDSEATRRQLKLKTTLLLTDNQTKKTILKNILISIASYNVLQSEFSTIVTEQSARENALDDLARQIERQIVIHLNK